MMKDTSEVQEINLSNLFPYQLVDIRLYEIAISRCDQEKEGAKEKDEYPIKIRLHESDLVGDTDAIALLLAFDATFDDEEKPVCDIHLSIEGRFNPVVDPASVEAEKLERFKSQDALVLFWPYLRQILHDVTDRMRLRIPPLPILDQRAIMDITISNKEDA